MIIKNKNLKILYDLRTNLGENNINYLEVGANEVNCPIARNIIVSHKYPTVVYKHNMLPHKNLNLSILFINKEDKIIKKFFIYHKFLNPESFILISNYLSNKSIKMKTLLLLKQIKKYNLPYYVPFKNQKLDNFVIKKKEFNKNIKFAVIVATYWRKNGESVYFLNNLFNCLDKQQYRDFKLFLIGDDYSKHKEFNDICKQYNNDIYYKNLDTSFRKNVFSIDFNKWSSGGSNARFYGIKEAIKQGYDYYLHIDDDDTWKSNHIQIIYDMLQQWPNSDFIFTAGNMKNKKVPNPKNCSINYNNYIPRPGYAIHSTWCINLNTMGNFISNIFKNRLDIINKIKTKQIKETKIKALDALILTKIKNYVKQGIYNTLFIPEVTCNKYGGMHIPD